MSEEITASSKVDVPSYLLAFKWSASRKAWQRKLLCVFIVIGASYAAWLGVSDGDVPIRDILPSLLLLGGLAFFIRRSNDQTRLAQQIEQMPGYGEPTTWTIKQDGYVAELGENHESISWKDVFETVATPDGALIYLQKSLFEWFPKSAFASEGDYTRFLDLLAAKTKHSKLG